MCVLMTGMAILCLMNKEKSNTIGDCGGSQKTNNNETRNLYFRVVGEGLQSGL